jgi:hypothetical protein
LSGASEDRGGLSFGDLKFGLSTAAKLVQADPEWNTVCAIAQIYIEDRVKSPGSESFSGCHIVSVSGDKKTVVVAGSVTAANSFNARIRSNYTASIMKKPEALHAITTSARIAFHRS